MIAINTDKPVSIGGAAEVSNTTVKMLRYWEEKGHISPERVYSGSRGFRWYSPADLQKITRIKNYIDQGYTLQAAARMADEEKSSNRRNI
jgi:DNA-binding transcriptional MerR regulator